MVEAFSYDFRFIISSYNSIVKPGVLEMLFILLFLRRSFARLLLLLVSVKSTEYYEIRKLDHNPGLFFEFVGYSNIVVSYWKVITHVDLEPYERSLGKLEAG